MHTARSRTIAATHPVIDQVDVFEADDFTRVVGLDLSDFSLTLYRDNQVQNWTVLAGSLVSDAQVISGRIYFREISNGVYSVRFRPNVVGFWRLLVVYPAGEQVISLSYDVVPEDVPVSGLLARLV